VVVVSSLFRRSRASPSCLRPYKTTSVLLRQTHHNDKTQNQIHSVIVFNLPEHTVPYDHQQPNPERYDMLSYRSIFVCQFWFWRFQGVAEYHAEDRSAKGV
jgi:hypothetical protein